MTAWALANIPTREHPHSCVSADSESFVSAICFPPRYLAFEMECTFIFLFRYFSEQKAYFINGGMGVSMGIGDWKFISPCIGLFARKILKINN